RRRDRRRAGRDHQRQRCAADRPDADAGVAMNGLARPSLVPTRKGDWMQTFTGRRFWPLDPRPDEICIEDIAHALSMQCRYAGHCLSFYSVAEHSVLLSQHVAEPFRRWALLHDASEAYLVDVPRPIKGDLSNYRAVEAR